MSLAILSLRGVYKLVVEYDLYVICIIQFCLANNLNFYDLLLCALIQRELVAGIYEDSSTQCGHAPSFNVSSVYQPYT